MTKTERTIINPLDVSDIPKVIKMYREPDSNKYIEPLLNKTDEMYSEFLKQKIASVLDIPKFWAVYHHLNHEFIGTINLNTIQPLNIVHIGCHISVQFWNDGYATELMQGLVGWGFKERRLSEIHALIQKDHYVSKKLFKKLGFSFLRSTTLGKSEIEIFRLKNKELKKRSKTF